jgi:hypothetical protein
MGVEQAKGTAFAGVGRMHELTDEFTPLAGGSGIRGFDPGWFPEIPTSRSG